MLVQRYQVLIPGTCVYCHMHRKILTVVTKLKPLTWGGLPWVLQEPSRVVLAIETHESLPHTEEQACEDRTKDWNDATTSQGTRTATRNGEKRERVTYTLKKDLCPANS